MQGSYGSILPLYVANTYLSAIYCNRPPWTGRLTVTVLSYACRSAWTHLKECTEGYDATL